MPVASPADLTPAHIRPHFFDKGGLGSKIAAGLGEFALQYSANMGQPGSLAILQNRMQQQRDERSRMATLAQEIMLARLRRNQPQIFNGGDGQILSVDPITGTATEIHAARPAQPKISEQQSLIDYWNVLPANDPRRPMIERAIRGYQYTPDVMDARQQNAMQMEDYRQQHRTDLRGMPTYAQTHPSGGSKGGGQPGYEYRVVAGKLMRRKKQ